MQDLRLAFRTLLRRPGFFAVALLTLALGIGANTAVFSVTRAVLLAPLPYERPDEIVILGEHSPQFATASVTRYNFEDWRARARSFVDIAAFRPTNVTVTGDAGPERVPAKMLTATLLPLLGVTLPQGRNFSEAEDRAGGEAAAIVSSGFAQRRFAGENPIGRVLQVDDRPRTIVGVMPPHFELFAPADIYLPFGPWARTLPEDRGWHPGIFPVARLKAGVSIDAARKEMERISQQLEAEYPESNKNVRALITRAQDQVVQNVKPALLMLSAAVAIVLLIACANVANLLLARAVDRKKETALRIALGASRFRIVRQFVIESLVLALLGGLAGILVASWSVALLEHAVTALPRSQNVQMNWSVAYFALGLSALTGLVFGLAPAIQAARQPLRDSLNEESRGASGSARQTSTRAALVVIEVALALVLLVGAGLLLRSFATLTRVDPGFDAKNLLVVNLPMAPNRFADNVRRTATVQRILDRVRTLPGVERAAVTTGLPMTGAGATIHFNRQAQPPKGPDDYVAAGFRAVTAEYLSTLGVALKRGRLLADSDREGSPHVVVINESMARTYFPDRDPLGQRIQLGTEPDPGFPTMEIVGVVGDVKQSFEAGSKAEMFVPYGQYPDPILAGMYMNVALVARTTQDPLHLAGAFREAIKEINPDQPLVNLRTMESAVAGTVAQPRLQLLLVLVFAGVALALAAIGVYGVMAYTVSQRIQEIGIRMAIGASPEQVLRMIVRDGARMALLGIAIGMAAAAMAAAAIRSLLFQIEALDPATFVMAPLLLAAVALLASYLPARRASRLSPVTALM